MSSLPFFVLWRQVMAYSFGIEILQKFIENQLYGFYKDFTAIFIGFLAKQSHNSIIFAGNYQI